MKIENIVSSGTLNCEINLKLLSEQCDSVHYGHNKYPGGYVRFDGHSITIYRTGKYIMPGMRSVEDIHSSFQKFLSILSPFLDISQAEQPAIRNIVASSDTGYSLDLSTVYLHLSQTDYDVVYEPESFPGLILKIDDVTFNVFQSGKFLILGCTEEKSILQAEDWFVETIKELMSY